MADGDQYDVTEASICVNLWISLVLNVVGNILNNVNTQLSKMYNKAVVLF